MKLIAIKVTENITVALSPLTINIPEYQDALLSSRISLPIEDLPLLIAALKQLHRTSASH